MKHTSGLDSKSNFSAVISDDVIESKALAICKQELSQSERKVMI